MRSDIEFATIVFSNICNYPLDDLNVQGMLYEVRQLDGRYQQILEYHFRYDLKFREIDRRTGFSQGRARNIIHKSICMLRHPSRMRNISIRKRNLFYDEMTDKEYITYLRNTILHHDGLHGLAKFQIALQAIGNIERTNCNGYDGTMQ